MEFVFRLSDYGDPALDSEAARLLEQRLEAQSRRAAPGVWRWVDLLRSRAAGGQEMRWRRIYGAVLLALGVFLLVPGLAEPGSPVLIGAGVLGTVYGSLLVDKGEKAVPAARFLPAGSGEAAGAEEGDRLERDGGPPLR